MTDSVLRIVVDTNVLLSFLIKRNSKPGVLVTETLYKHQLLISSATLEELEDKCKRPKFRSYFTASEAQELVQLLSRVSEKIAANITLVDCRDAKDNKFLELAVAGRANLLVTGDKDLLDLHPYHGIPILNPHESLLYLGIEYTQE